MTTFDSQLEAPGDPWVQSEAKYQRFFVILSYRSVIALFDSPARLLEPLGPSLRHLGVLLEASWLILESTGPPPWEPWLPRGDFCLPGHA